MHYKHTPVHSPITPNGRREQQKLRGSKCFVTVLAHLYKLGYVYCLHSNKSKTADRFVRATVTLLLWTKLQYKYIASLAAINGLCEHRT